MDSPGAILLRPWKSLLRTALCVIGEQFRGLDFTN